MKTLIFAKRNIKELSRDLLSLAFGIVLPIVLLVLISLINKGVSAEAPIAIFEMSRFAPGIAVFSYSFICLFAGILMATDRASSFLMRIFASPMKSSDYILGYSLPLLPLALVQSILCFTTAIILGLTPSWNILLAIVAMIPAAVLFISLGLLIGVTCTEKQVGGIGSIIIQIAALFSGMWFPLESMGGLKTFCYCLPFAHALDIVQSVMAGAAFSTIIDNILVVLAYAAVIMTASILIFKKKMKN